MTEIEASPRRAFLRNVGMLGTAVLLPTGTHLTSESETRTAPSTVPAIQRTSASLNRDVVETTLGKIRGYTSNGIHTFKGVPYGAPTDGASRFRPPAKPKPWSGVRDTLVWGYVSPQRVQDTVDQNLASFIFEPNPAVQGEDCLCLNLWTPALDSGKRPVMLWIHGGDYTYGSSQDPKTEGENLCRRGDVVVITLNHRLGSVGFLDLSAYGEQFAASGNVGMLDIVLALEWVRNNVANFGGNPDNVTLFGHSGGGLKVSTLMLMPSAKGLFHRAIVQSGSLVVLKKTVDTRDVAAEALKKAGLSANQVAELQLMPFRKLVDLVEGPNGQYHPPNRRLGPVVDGSYIPFQPTDPHAVDVSADVPLLMGTTLNEWKTGLGDSHILELTEKQAKEALRDMYGDKSALVYDAFAASHKEALAGMIMSMSMVADFRVRLLTQAERKLAKRSAHVWLYRFDWRTPIFDGIPMAFHGLDVPFVFYNTDRCANATGGGKRARSLSGRISDAWVSFARTGNPNHTGLPHWSPAAAGKWETMLFNDLCVMRNDPDGAAYELVRSIPAS